MDIKKKGKSNRAFLAFFIIFILLFVSSNSFAESKIPRVKLTVKPLDLSRVPTTEELMAAGQLGGQLHPTDDIQINDTPVNPTLEKGGKGGFLEEKIKRNREINLSFGQAIQEWNKHEYKKAVKMFRKHMEDFADSPWVSESELHIGCDATYNGRYTEAEEMFTKIINDNKERKHEGAKMLLNKAKQRLANLKVLQSNFDEALKLYSELKKDSPDWRHRTYASHWIQRISQYKKNELALLNCGTQALAHVLRKKGKETEAREVMEMMPSSLNGNSIKDLKAIAEKYGVGIEGLKLTLVELRSVPLPAIIQINAKKDGDRGHYWVLEETTGDRLMLYDPQSGRRFNQSAEEFSKEWNGNTIVFSNGENLPGIRLSAIEMETIYGACCGIPLPEGFLGNPEQNAADDKDQDCPNGSPIWKVNVVNLNLFITDVPLWYEPPIGPPVRIQLSYNSQSAIANNEPFGNKWQFNYGSYLVEDTSGRVTIFMPDGKRDSYSLCGYELCGYISPYQVLNKLTKIAANHFELRFPDDTVYVYDIPSGTNSLQPFLVEIRDVNSQSLTFGYDADIHLTTITDAMSRVTNFIYDTNGLVTQVTDPFLRSATFEYGPDRNLTKITDMGGYWTELDYDTDVYPTKIENARGKWDFFIEPSDNLYSVSDPSYPQPGDNMWANSRITIKNPSGGIEEYYYQASGLIPTWYVSPKYYTPWQSATDNNYANNVPKTKYYLIPMSGSVGSAGEIARKDYPEGKSIVYEYDSFTGYMKSMKDYYGHTTSYTYNNMGQKTSITDARGFTTSIAYADNGVDLLEIQNGLGKISLTYNSAHDVSSITDRLGNANSFQYNTYGQLIQSTDASGIVTVFTYDSNNNLQQVTRDGNVLDSFTYDYVGRIDTHTDSTGLTLDYDYNDLNNVTKITYPDGKFESYTYSGCCPRLMDSMTDRSGKTTRYTHDAMKRLVEAVDPEGRTTKYEYDANGNLARLIDPNSNVTTFEYDSENRFIRKNYADGKYERYSYYNTGLLKDQTNGRGITTDYAYDQNYNLLTETYSDSTPGVTYTYDNYNRITQRQDGIGAYVYSYDLNSRLTSIDGPWANDTITFQYDKLGQLKTLSPQGGQVVTYFYDYDTGYADPDIGRLKEIKLGASTFAYSYTGVNPLIQSLARPNGSFTEYLYNDSLKRLTEITNKTSTQEIINKHVFTYNNLDLIGTETITTGTPFDAFTAGLKTYNYNNVNQLLASTNPAEIFTYDDDGNMTQGYTSEGYVFTATYDAENRLKSIQYTDSGNVVHRTEYYYGGDSMLAQAKKYDNGVLVSDTMLVKAGFLPLQERDGNNAVTREYTWGLNLGGGVGGLLNLSQNGNNYSYLYDGKGNVTALLDSLQSVVASYRYDVFGKPLKKTGTLDQPYRFSTKQYDEQTGHYGFGYRFYSPSVGRWMTRDPLGEAGGANLYQMVGNNPINYIDPLGLMQFKRGVRLSNQGLLLKLYLLESKLPKGYELMVTEGDRTFEEYRELYPSRTYEQYLKNTHAQGIAADIHPIKINSTGCDSNISIRSLSKTARERGFTGIGIYDKHLHIDERNIPAIWTGISK